MSRWQSALALVGQPIGTAIPPSSIKEVFVPVGSVNNVAEPSDDRIRALFTKCTFITDKEFHSLSLAPWKTLTIRTMDGEQIPLELMLAGLGRVELYSLGTLPFRCSS